MLQEAKDTVNQVKSDNNNTQAQNNTNSHAASSKFILGTKQTDDIVSNNSKSNIEIKQEDHDSFQNLAESNSIEMDTNHDESNSRSSSPKEPQQKKYNFKTAKYFFS